MLTTILLGGITHHYVAPKLNYCNRINKIGTIRHTYAAILVGNDKIQAGPLMGVDSACGAISGALLSVSISEFFKIMAGGYNTNFKEFNDRGINPPTFMGLTPLAGLDYRLNLYKSKDLNISLDTLISYGIVSHGISVSF